MENKVYEKWMKSINVSKEMKDEMKKMTADQIEASFKEEPIKFGTAGYRAVMGPGPLFLNEHTYQQLAVGYAKFILFNHEAKDEKAKKSAPRVLIAHDNRRNGKEFAILVGNVLSAYGIEVYFPQNNMCIATPMVSFLVREFQFDGAINITASHNPKEYNGFKAYNSTGAQVSTNEAEMISEFLPDVYTNLQKTYNANIKNMYFIGNSWLKKYYSSITQSLNITNHKKYINKEPVVITTHHGAASTFIKGFLESLGHNIVLVPSQCYEDSEFTNSPIMNPEDPESFKAAIELANKIGSKICLGIDPDGDRLAIAVKNKKEWIYLNGNETGILATYYIMKYKNFNGLVPVLVSTYVSTSLVNEIVGRENGLVLRTATGFKNIALAMEHIDREKSDYVLGFEESIGMNTSLSTREKDTFAASALLLEMYDFYHAQGYNLFEVLENRIYPIYGLWCGESVSIKISGANWKSKTKVLEKKALTIKKGTKIGALTIKNVFWNSAGDCIEWDLGNESWIKFRVSGTEPKFKIYFNLLLGNAKFSYEARKELIKKLTKSIKGKLGI